MFFSVSGHTKLSCLGIKATNSTTQCRVVVVFAALLLIVKVIHGIYSFHSHTLGLSKVVPCRVVPQEQCMNLCVITVRKKSSALFVISTPHLRSNFRPKV